MAGLLMFGRERSILDALPYYQLDYRELSSSDPEQRWNYRLTIDGKWEPNLFNFYYSVYGRLVKDLAIPFQLDEEAVRRDETHVHQALREGLVNTLVHADHQSVRPILITKRADIFLFSNPGRLRIPLQRLYEGGMSDPRNPNLQKMFQMIGLGEKAGSGFQKILWAWQEQSWAVPLVSEKLDVEITSILLPMISMIPEAVTKELKEIVGDAYSALSQIDRIALVLAHRLNAISNSDIRRHRTEHPQEIGERLTYLVERGWLERHGRGRGTRYSLCKLKQEDSIIPKMNRSSGHYDANSGHYDISSGHYAASSGHYSPSSGLYEAEGYPLDAKHYDGLMALAKPIREKRRANREQVKRIILKLCAEHYLSIKQLSEFLDRNSESLRKHYINILIKEGFLQLRYPGIMNHPQQRYKTIARSES